MNQPIKVMTIFGTRPEGIKAGTLKLAGIEEQPIYELATELLTDPQAYEKMAGASIRMETERHPSVLLRQSGFILNKQMNGLKNTNHYKCEAARTNASWRFFKRKFKIRVCHSG